MSGPDELSRDELIVVVRRQAVQISAQAVQISELVQANETLAGRLAKLEHLLSRNSGNSSSPPSRDGDPGKPAPPQKRRGRGGPTSAKNGLGMCEHCEYEKESPGRQVVTADENGVHTAEFVTPTGANYRSTAPSLPGATMTVVSEIAVRIGIAIADLHAA